MRCRHRQIYFEDVDPSAFSHVARVEVLKGPGISLFGQEGLGGTINIVTKRQQTTPAIELQGAFGEDDLATGTFDVTGPLVQGGALSARTLAPDGWIVDACPVNGPSLSAQGETVAAVPAAFPAWWRRAGRCWWPGWPATARRGTCRRACRGPPTCPETAACDILSHPCGAGPLVG